MKRYVNYADNVDSKTWSQFCDAIKQDFVVRGALMPDAHMGYTLPIGAVVATDNIVVPSYVGFDIGCGLCAQKTTFNKQDVIDNSQAIFDQIYHDVPVGFKHNQEDTNWHQYLDLVTTVRTNTVQNFLDLNGFKQLGSLGGGNHFIEIGYDEDAAVWVIIHSGSRGIGHKTATHYMRRASLLHTGIKKAKEGHYGFEADSNDGIDYITDMNYCLEFALANRREMMTRAVMAVGRNIRSGERTGELINRNHNHIDFKDGMWIHRKGATHAEEGMMGVIPGNMRDGSFIVEGRGCKDALWSSSHGAGRVMGRKVAKETLSMDEFKLTMHGVTALVKQGTLDESPMAYKDIFEVMKMQDDLVTMKHHVKPIINIKG